MPGLSTKGRRWRLVRGWFVRQLMKNLFLVRKNLSGVALAFLFLLCSCLPVNPSIPPTETRSLPTNPPQPTETLPATPVATALVTSTPLPQLISHPILSDQRVRQAIAFCTDRASLVRAVYPWLKDPLPFLADSFIPPGHWAYMGIDPDFPRYPYSPEQGKLLLEDAGWKLSREGDYRTNESGLSLTLTLTTTEAKFRQAWTEVWEEQMKACGVQVIRKQTPAAWFFGTESGISRRDFEMAAFAWIAFYGSDGISRFACDQIPSPANDWNGQNFTGWCSQVADKAIKSVQSSVQKNEQRLAYRDLQWAYALDVPELPLFYQVSMFAINPVLENFLAPDDGIHTWNAAQWSIPGQDTIVIGEDGEPASLDWSEKAYVSDVIRALITGVDFTWRGYEPLPVLLKQVPTLENGGAIEEVVSVGEGDRIVDRFGTVIPLQPGVEVYDAAGREVLYSGGQLTMRRLVITYSFVDGLTWSDGTPVSRADYELAYRAMCDPAVRGTGPVDAASPDPYSACGEIASVEFPGDTEYQVKWLPGSQAAVSVNFTGPDFLPPFSRMPAHQMLADGRRLGDVPIDQWLFLDEITRNPLGVGPL